MNKTILLARITKTPELRHTQSDKPVANFTLAVNRPFKNPDGEYEADFINCVAWGRTAEVISEHFDKGSRIIVEGRIQTRTYENAEGKNVYVTEVVVESFGFVDSKNTQDQPTEEKKTVHKAPVVVSEDDLPF